MFVMNLFVGVVIDSFNETRKERGAGHVFMTQEQEEWASTQKLLMSVKPKKNIPRPKEHLKGLSYDLAKNPKFDASIMICIILNSIILGIQYFGQPEAYSLSLEILNYIFAFIFTFEAAVKIYGFTFKRYWEDSWNKFDLVIVIGTFLGIAVSLSTSANVGPIASVVRIFRIGRIFRLINSAESLRRLFNTLVTSVPSLTNIGGLLLLLFFIYAVCGVQLFAKIKHHDDVSHHANFTNLWVAMLTLFRFSTGENWNGFMYTLSEKTSGCEDDPAYNKHWCETNGYEENCVPVNGCGSWAVFPFFYSFTLTVTFVMLNLFIGIILDSFSDTKEVGGLSPQDLEEFTRVWSVYDPEASGFIDVDHFDDLLQNLEPPLGFGANYVANEQELGALIDVLDVAIREFVEDGKVHDRIQFLDVMRALTKRVFILKQGGSSENLLESDEMTEELNQHLGGSTYKLSTYLSESKFDIEPKNQETTDDKTGEDEEGQKTQRLKRLSLLYGATKAVSMGEKEIGGIMKQVREEEEEGNKIDEDEDEKEEEEEEEEEEDDQEHVMVEEMGSVIAYEQEGSTLDDMSSREETL
jgi:hypothetical protein